MSDPFLRVRYPASEQKKLSIYQHGNVDIKISMVLKWIEQNKTVALPRDAAKADHTDC